MTRKKTITLFVVIPVIVAVAVTGIIFGKNYINDRYSGTDYYTMVPTDYDVTPTPIKSDDGSDMGLGKEYNLTVYNADGESRDVSFTVYDPSSPYNHGKKPPQPGEWLLVSASKQIVVGWNRTEKSAVPKAALGKIERSSASS